MVKFIIWYPERFHPAFQMWRQHLVMELSGTIHEYIRNNHNDSQVLPAPLAVRLNADDKTYVEPDISGSVRSSAGT